MTSLPSFLAATFPLAGTLTHARERAAGSPNQRKSYCVKLIARAALMLALSVGDMTTYAEDARPSPTSGSIDLFESLGFNKLCEGDPAPKGCPRGVTRIQTGTCLKTVCIQEPETTAPSCPEAMQCPPGTNRKEAGTDARGCPVTECAPIATECPKAATCAPGTTAKTVIGHDGCKVIECEPAQKQCPEITQCPPGTTRKVSGAEANGCPIIECTLVAQCPQAATCAPGTTAKTVMGPDGCKTVRCEPVQKQCPEVMQCPPGTNRKVSSAGANGCPKVECAPVAKQCPQITACASGTIAKQTVRADGCKAVVCEQKKPCPRGHQMDQQGLHGSCQYQEKPRPKPRDIVGREK